jgi:hypothetical protein
VWVLFVCLFKYERLITRGHTRPHYLDHYFDFFVYTQHRACRLRVLFICQPRELGHIGGESRVGLINLNCVYFPHTNKNNAGQIDMPLFDFSKLKMLLQKVTKNSLLLGVNKSDSHVSGKFLKQICSKLDD